LILKFFFFYELEHFFYRKNLPANMAPAIITYP